MIFCFSDIDFDKVVEEYGAMISPNDILLFTREVVGLVDMPAELSGKTSIFKGIVEYSGDKGVIIVVAMRAKIGEKIFNSAMVIDNGHILGVSDEITPQKGYVGSSTVRTYCTSRGKICVFVDSDICYPSLWQSALSGCRYIFNLNSSDTDNERISSAKTLANASGKYVLCKFLDSGVCINSYGKIESIKWGKMTAFYLPLTFAVGRTVKSKIKFVDEQDSRWRTQ
ncbi:MAG: hypothetical protein K2K85_07245 [Clostridia bacterium]|nr:hypothetical protein [Clostridia bacterium]